MMAGSAGGPERPEDVERDRMTERGAMTRSEEELTITTESDPVGEVGLHKHVDTEHVRQVVDRGVERGDVERAAAQEGDSGEIETLPDGSVSVPVFEEQIVVEKRLVVRERVIIRKSTVIEEHVIEADLRRERIDVEADESVVDRVSDARDG
jgi:uncharacterized protein (TIGR02271 family)